MLTEPSTVSHTVRLGFPSAAKALGGAQLSEGLHQGHATRFRHPPVQTQESHGAVWAPHRHWGSRVINKKILRNICKVRNEQHIVRNVLEHVSQRGCAETLEALRTWLDRALSKVVWSQSWPCPKQEAGLETSSGPFPPEFSSGLLVSDVLTHSWPHSVRSPSVSPLQINALLATHYPGQQALTSPTPSEEFQGPFNTKV